MAYDQTTQHAIDNLAHWVEQYRAENVGKATLPVVAAAEHLLRVASPEAVEDREYYNDIELPRSERCLAKGPYGRICSRRYQHVSERHRDMEVSWTDEMVEGK